MGKDEETLRKYWKALAAVDAEGMAACYAPDATFRDPVFRVQGAQVGAMWRMLFASGGDLKITTGPLSVEGNEGDGTLEAVYTFSMTGRRVHNRIRSHFHLNDGRIVEQVDTFPFWRWSRMALGAKGLLLGWTPLVRNAVRRRAKRRLEAAMATR